MSATVPIMVRSASSGSTNGCSDDQLSGDRCMAAIDTAQRVQTLVRPWTPARGYALLLIAPAAVLAIYFIWPLVQVVIRSLVEPELGLGNYARIFATTTYLRVIANTLTLAATVALMT